MACACGSGVAAWLCLDTGLVGGEDTVRVGGQILLCVCTKLLHGERPAPMLRPGQELPLSATCLYIRCDSCFVVVVILFVERSMRGKRNKLIRFLSLVAAAFGLFLRCKKNIRMQQVGPDDAKTLIAAHKLGTACLHTP